MSSASSPTPAPRPSIFNNRNPPSPSRSMFNRNPPASEPRVESPAEEKPSIENDKPIHISITVRDGHNNQSFKMRRDRPLKKLMEASSMNLGKDLKSWRFMLDGVRVTETDTPDKVCFQIIYFFLAFLFVFLGQDESQSSGIDVLIEEYLLSLRWKMKTSSRSLLNKSAEQFIFSQRTEHQVSILEFSN